MFTSLKKITNFINLGLLKKPAFYSFLQLFLAIFMTLLMFIFMNSHNNGFSVPAISSATSSIPSLFTDKETLEEKFKLFENPRVLHLLSELSKANTRLPNSFWSIDFKANNYNFISDLNFRGLKYNLMVIVEKNIVLIWRDENGDFYGQAYPIFIPAKDVIISNMLLGREYDFNHLLDPVFSDNIKSMNSIIKSFTDTSEDKKLKLFLLGFFLIFGVLPVVLTPPY